MSLEVERKLPSEPGFTNIHSATGVGEFNMTTNNFQDDLSSFAIPSGIEYRVKMTIEGDTSFYFNPVTISHNNACITYNFIGSGNWSDPSNWLAAAIPPPVLPAGGTIFINPVAGEECVLNVNQQIQRGAVLTVLPGKKLLIEGSLDIQ